MAQTAAFCFRPIQFHTRYFNNPTIENTVSGLILPDGTLGGHLEAVGNPDGVDALVQQILGLLQQCPAQNHHARSAVTNLIILGEETMRS